MLIPELFFSLIQPIQGTAIVIIHPGSQNLYIGRAADSYPHIVPHCIAWKHANPGQQHFYQDPWLVRPECLVSILQYFCFLGLQEYSIQYLIRYSALFRNFLLICTIWYPAENLMPN